MPTLTLPKLMDNHGNFVGSLGNVCRYLGQKAEALGVEIYPGFPAAEVLTGDKGEVVGVATGDMGMAKNGEPKATLPAAWSCALNTPSWPKARAAH